MIGAMKAGTTSLYHYLRSHPQVFMPDVKEPMFFDPRHNWHRGPSWYAGLFAAARPEHVALGEASTSYTKYPVVEGVPARIASVLPHARLIYVLRHPIDRMRSHYLYLVSRGKERRPIERALLEDPHYLDVSRYAMQLEQYLPYFGPDRFLLLDSRDLAERRVETLRRVFGFLGVDEGWVPPLVDREFHRSADRRMPSPLGRAARAVPGLRRAARRLPGPVREVARRISAPRLDLARATVPEDLRRRLEDELREDVRRLRRYMPQGFDGWGIA
ncbi:MAG TPA: sulfotransferase [Actinomycetota bacterium]|nr:sulfotransferase [Actinomycetota bacterium]